MIIRELNLLGFGRFDNKKIELEEGINVIYGENEAGKTTIHNFVNGMFYGFLKPYVKRTIYLDEHEMYRPWSGKKYSGVIKFKTDNEEYIIEREFTKSEETTKVFLEKTGEDITNNLDTKNKTRIIQPGNHFFGFNDAVYGNTISVKQSQNRIQEDLSKEIKEKLINLSTSMDNEVSIKKAIKELETALKEIGSSRAPTSYYGRNYIELKSLEQDKEEILKNKDEYLEAIELNISIDKKLDEKSNEIEVLEDRLKKIILLEKRKIYDEVKAIKDDIAILDTNKNKYKEYKDLSLDDYLKGINLDGQIKNIKQRTIELEETLIELEKNIQEIKEKKDLNFSIDKSIEDDFLNYERLEEEKEGLTLQINNEIEFIKRDLKEDTVKIKNNNIFLISSIIVSAISIVLSFVSNIAFLSINLITIPIIIFSFFRSKKLNIILNNRELDLNSLEKSEDEKKQRISDIDEDKNRIIKKYNVDDKFQFKILFDEYKMSFYAYREESSLLEEYINRKKTTLERLEKDKLEYKELKVKLKLILNNNFTSSLDELKDGIDKAKLYKELKLSLNVKDELLKKVIGDLCFEELEKELKDLQINLKESEKESSSLQLKDILKEKYEKIAQIKIEKSSHDARISFLDRSISKLIEIEEKIYMKKELLKSLDEKIQSLELAKDTIEDLSKNIQREFAPILNKRVGNIIDIVTKGKYSKIRIDDKLEMGVIDNITGEMIDIKDLSGGTIDQIYFALRFGIINSLTDKKPPLILDDCFVQYDNSRLENIIDLLIEESKLRQIILFTCHKREFEVLYNRKTKFNLVQLT